jgi:hypothetical protein
MAYCVGALWIIKGNNTNETWVYVPPDEEDRVIPSMVTSAVGQGFRLANLKVCPTLSVVPNPFTKLTTIKYIVPIAGKVSLKLYNTTGRLVETIQNGYLTAGTYTTNLTTNNFAKGIYFLRYIDTHNQKEIKLIME